MYCWQLGWQSHQPRARADVTTPHSRQENVSLWHHNQRLTFGSHTYSWHLSKLFLLFATQQGSIKLPKSEHCNMLSQKPLYGKLWFSYVEKTPDDRGFRCFSIIRNGGRKNGNTGNYSFFPIFAYDRPPQMIGKHWYLQSSAGIFPTYESKA
jgi:hypothetical protein